MAGKKNSGSAIMRELRGLLFIAAAVFAFHGLAAKPYYVPSSSMAPTLLDGDRILVSKYPYGWSWASIPFHLLPRMDGRLLAEMPERGDIVTVVKRGTSEDLIKRVIGLPGDTIAVRRGIVSINGKAVARRREADALIPIDANWTCSGPMNSHRVGGVDGKDYCRLPRYRETLPNGRSYDTIDLGDEDLGNGYSSPGDDFGPVQIPQGSLFLMGDNRDDSADSRFSLEEGGLGGPVPLNDIGGRAELITHSYDGHTQLLNPITWFTSLRSGRAGTSLRPDSTG